MIADHLSRLEQTAEKEKGTEIAENFLDEQLFYCQFKHLGMLILSIT